MVQHTWHPAAVPSLSIAPLAAAAAAAAAAGAAVRAMGLLVATRSCSTQPAVELLLLLLVSVLPLEAMNP
jgi:hypothetical protein